MLVACLAIPAQAQVCKPAATPLPNLLPKAVQGLDIEFCPSPGAGLMTMYRHADQARWLTDPWTVVTLEPLADASVGESPASARAYLGNETTPFITVAEWPVRVSQLPMGDEFKAVKGSVQVTVLVKNGDQGQASEALATAFLERILAKVPCG
jgi:hypothetical protein